jgi:hypothetical protein
MALDLRLDLHGLVEGVTQQAFLVGLQFEDARVAGIGILVIDRDRGP